MILTAQRVCDPRGQTGINCYHLGGGEFQGHASLGPSARLHQPATLLWQHREIADPGARVLSFVDIAAPDPLDWTQIERTLRALLKFDAPPALFALRDGEVALRLHIQEALLSKWKGEVVALVQRLGQVHP